MVQISMSLLELSRTFLASLRSIGTAVTMASVGYYLHQTNSVGSDGKRTLAVLSQQITFPLFLFTKILYCNQDWSDKPCPDVTKSLTDVWMLLFWPIYVVGVGLLVGVIVAKASNTPRHHLSSVLAACAFGNSTGLPITLLNVIHSNFPSTSDLGRIDPTLFLSVFLLLYPVLQWGLGGWLLAPEGHGSRVLSSTVPNYSSSDDISSSIVNGNDVPESFDRTVMSNSSFRKRTLNGQGRKVSSADEGLYLSELDLHSMDDVYASKENVSLVSDNGGRAISKMADELQGHPTDGQYLTGESGPLLGTKIEAASSSKFGQCRIVLERCFQPPVIGAVAGIVCVSFPWLRGLFVDMDDRDNGAPFQFLFDGLYAVGQTAVPINMMILGCNLSSSLSLYKTLRSPSEANVGLLSMRTMVGVVIGKMIVIPFIGILSAWILKSFFWNIPKDIDGAFYLVLMIVFLTPTANNVMVMIELSGSGAKEGMANVIALQYLVAPLILSCTMTIAIGVASGWSS